MIVVMPKVQKAVTTQRTSPKISATTVLYGGGFDLVFRLSLV